MSLHAVFSPKSIAVIGASTQPGSVGNDLVKNLTQGFAGRIYPVNPKGGELYGLPVFVSVGAIPQSVDLAIVAVPAAVVPDVLVQAGKKKVKAVIVISAGFKEVGNVELEEKIAAIAKKYRFTLVGPNCLGMMNPHLSLNASFAPTMPDPGSIAFLSQSGALGVAVLDYAKANNLGFSKFLSVGNKAALEETELLEYLARDPATKVILLYVEQLADFKKILKVAHTIRRLRHPKPIIVLKSGQTPDGAQAAQSHTGSLAGNDALYDALFRQAGMIRANNIEELFLYAECFMYNPLLKKDRVAVVTNAGGIGILVTDALVQEDLTLADLAPQTKTKLQQFLPSAASVHNPVDILGDAKAERYAQTLAAVIADDAVDAIVVLLTPQSMTEVAATARVILDAKKTTKKPIVVSFLGGGKVAEGIGILQKGALTTTDFPESAAKGLGVIHRFSLWKNKDDAPPTFRGIQRQQVNKIVDKHARKGQWLPEIAMYQILECYRLPLVPWAVVTDERELPAAVERCGKTVVLKVMSPDIVHKSDVGGVLLNVTAETAVASHRTLLERVAAKQPEAKITGVLVMQQAEQDGLEIIVGAVRDPNLGALVGCGMGGIFTETFDDAAFALAPLTLADSKDLLERLRIGPLLRGARGQQPFDTKVLLEIIGKISQLVTDFPQIAEIDINPVLLSHRRKGAVILDARIRLA